MSYHGKCPNPNPEEQPIDHPEYGQIYQNKQDCPVGLSKGSDRAPGFASNKLIQTASNTTVKLQKIKIKKINIYCKTEMYF